MTDTARDSKMNFWEKAAVFLAILGALYGVIEGYITLNAKIDRINERIDRVEVDGADELCLQVVMRQMEAIEKDRPAVKGQLDKLAAQRGCATDYNTANAMVTDDQLSSEKIRDLEKANDRLNERIRKGLAEIDRELKDPDALDNVVEGNSLHLDGESGS